MDFVSQATGSNTHVFSLSNDGKLCIWKDNKLTKKPKMSGTLHLDVKWCRSADAHAEYDEKESVSASP